MATKKSGGTSSRSTGGKSGAGKATAKKPAAKAAAKKQTGAKRTDKKRDRPAETAKKTAAQKTAAQKTAAQKTAAQKPAAKKPAVQKKAAKPAPPFSVGDKVVHPQHGAAIIKDRMRQTVEGHRRDYFVLEIATDQLTVFVPVENIEETIRPVISRNQARKVFQLFKAEPQEAGSNWSRWYKVLNEKMTSGDIYQVAEVVRDLTYAQQTKGISPALKRMLSRARLTLSSELRFALDIDEEEASRRLDRALPRVEPEEGI